MVHIPTYNAVQRCSIEYRLKSIKLSMVDHHLIIDSTEFIIQTSTSFSRGRSPALRTAISAGICCILDPQIRNAHSRNHSAYQASHYPFSYCFLQQLTSVSLLSSYSICFAHLLSYWSTARQEKEGKGKECMWPVFSGRFQDLLLKMDDRAQHTAIWCQCCVFASHFYEYLHCGFKICCMSH